uniref:Transient receptor ion channel domain-containing protein n=1 Tax=Gopherus evgoodei TaxID=1825980 RepID=A0A8C4VK49_9SAUR
MGVTQRHAHHCVTLCPSQQPNWREIINKKLKFPRELLDAIQEGNLLRVQQLLQGSDGILQQQADSEDRVWREALNLAIRTGGGEITGTLLRYVKFDFRQIHEALLVAVDTNQPQVVKMLLDRLDQEKSIKMDIKSFSLAFFDRSIDNARFAPGVTPLTLACEKDLYEIVDMLVQKGHTIPRPHKISCTCLECSNGRKYDLLKFSLFRINTYKGIASRAYLSIASEDAILTAFKLSRELQRLSCKEPEFKVRLGSLFHSPSILVLQVDVEEEEELDSQAFEEGIPNLARLRLAVNYNQKRVSPGRRLGGFGVPRWCSALSQYLSIGLGGAAGTVFQMIRVSPRGLGAHASSCLAGFFWYECKEVWIEGLHSYLLDLWNCLDIVILSLYLASFALRVLVTERGYLHCLDTPSSPECYYFTRAGRHEWQPEDPQFVSEVLFAVTSMLSFTRLAYILPAHESLGTLQISIGKMIDDMIRFIFILVIILTAFLCGLNNTYVYYQEFQRLGKYGLVFNETFQFLFWTMFGMEEYSVVDMPQYALVEFVGRALYGIFTIVMVIVLLNMLIAMITNSFQKIEDDADVEWKFARSKLYLSYFREGLTLPVPFNIIPTPKSLFYSVSVGYCQSSSSPCSLGQSGVQTCCLPLPRIRPCSLGSCQHGAPLALPSPDSLPVGSQALLSPSLQRDSSWFSGSQPSYKGQLGSH